MKTHHIIMLLLVALSSCTKSKTEVSKSKVFDSVKVGMKFYRYKAIDKTPVFKTENYANIILPEFNRKSDSATLHKVLSKISLIENVRYARVAQDSATFKILWNPYKHTQMEEKIMIEKFIGYYDILTHKSLHSL